MPNERGTEMIAIGVDSNEQIGDRATDLARAAAERPTEFDLKGFGEYVVDAHFEWPDGALNAEFKLPADYVVSVLDKKKHLPVQLKEMAAAKVPAIILVLGGNEAIERCCFQRVIDAAASNRESIDQETAFERTKVLMKMLISFNGLAYRMNIPVLKLAPTKLDPLAPYRELLSYAKHLSEEPNLAEWLPRFPVDVDGYGILCSINGIGDAAAKALLDPKEGYGTIDAIVNEARFNPEALAGFRVNKKAMGRSKAGKIIKALTSSLPEAWA
ncbi:MAG TPA: helix-hairpin-helix domain-containing protein [Methanotrichaceae archaeon]|nr:helix-hairpin-helix domain-containing protein [Methanotrichaceae archaeon]